MNREFIEFLEDKKWTSYTNLLEFPWNPEKSLWMKYLTEMYTNYNKNYRKIEFQFQMMDQSVSIFEVYFKASFEHQTVRST